MCSIVEFDPVARQAVAARWHQARQRLPLAAELGVHRPGGAGGRAGDDDHARPQREARREEMDELRAGPDHFSRCARLPEIAVDAGLELELLRIGNLVRGDDARPQRGAGIERFAAAEVVPHASFGGPPDLAVARGHVVDDGVAEHVIERRRGRDMPAGLADDDGQLGLAIELLGQRGVVDDRARRGRPRCPRSSRRIPAPCR